MYVVKGRIILWPKARIYIQSDTVWFQVHGCCWLLYSSWQLQPYSPQLPLQIREHCMTGCNASATWYLQSCSSVIYNITSGFLRPIAASGLRGICRWRLIWSSNEPELISHRRRRCLARYSTQEKRNGAWVGVFLRPRVHSQQNQCWVCCLTQRGLKDQNLGTIYIMSWLRISFRRNNC